LSFSPRTRSASTRLCHSLHPRRRLLLERQARREGAAREPGAPSYRGGRLCSRDRRISDRQSQRGSPTHDQAGRRGPQAPTGRTRPGPTELENVKAAILRGLDTKTTRSLLEETEQKVERLEAALKTPPSQRVLAFPKTVEAALRDLRGTLDKDIPRARELLRKLIGKVTLRRDGDRLFAEVRGG